MLYEKFDRYWKIWMFIPIALLIISIIIISNNTITTGYFMDRNIELSGGKMITVGVESADLAKLRSAMPYAQIHLVTGITNTLQVEIPFDANETAVLNILKDYINVTAQPTIKTVGPALGEMFFSQAQLAIIIAFIFMAIVVFVLFRSLVPSSIVLLCAGTDILVAIAFSSLFGVELSLPVLAALLTIIGYSVDTDILLTTELLKTSKDDMLSGIKKATKTGLTMSLTTLAALLGLYFVSGSFVLEEMAFVLIIGILIDMPATWLTNAGVLRWWFIRKEHKKMRDKNE
jgi:preprotein translocase subunit SecF